MKTITLTISNIDMEFAPTQEMYGEYVAAITRGDLTDSAHNFVMQSALTDETKTALRELDMQNGGGLMQVAGVIASEYAPKVSISVKK